MKGLKEALIFTRDGKPIYLQTLIQFGPYVYRIISKSNIKGYAVYAIPYNNRAIMDGQSRHITASALRDAQIYGYM